MKCRFFLNVVISECSPIFKLFTGKNETLLVGRNTFLILNFSFDVIDRIGLFNFKCNCFSCQRFHEYLHLNKLRINYDAR